MKHVAPPSLVPLPAMRSSAVPSQDPSSRSGPARDAPKQVAPSQAPQEQDDAPSLNTPRLAPHQLVELERTFRARVEETRQPAHRLSRLRLWFLFLLVRHAALRLGEALGFDDESGVDLDVGLLRVGGAQSRDVPLPKFLVPELRLFFADPLIAPRRGGLARLDPGYVRRNFYARARECGLPPELASPRSLRQARAAELIQNGMPLPAVQKFLGQPSLESTGDMLPCSDEEIQSITRHYLQREARLRTSARNAFSGQITRIRHGGFMVEVKLTSFTGLELVAVITEDSLENLQLAEGKPVVATIKAPWVVLARRPCHPCHPCPADGLSVCARNRFDGVVSRVTRSEVACEVVVDLSEGSRVCALVTTESVDSLALAPGEPVTVLFKAFSVILSVV